MSVLKAKSYSHVPLRDVQQTLNANAAILEYILADPASYCLVIRRDAVDIVRLSGKQKIEGLVASYLKGVREKQPAYVGTP